MIWKMKIVSLILIIVLMLSNGVTAAVVTDNDASAFVTKAEYEAVKNNVQSQIDAYTGNLGGAIDGAIATYLSTIDLYGGSDVLIERVKNMLIEHNNVDWDNASVEYGGYTKAVFDARFPIGSYVMGDTQPAFGTWEKVNATQSGMLWIKNTVADGTTISEALPKPVMDTIKLQDVGAHKHGVGSYTIVGTVNTGRAFRKSETTFEGAFESNGDASTYVQYSSGNGSHVYLEAKDGQSFTGASASAGAHTHTFTPSIKIAGAYKDITSGWYPDYYCVVLWKRTA